MFRKRKNNLSHYPKSIDDTQDLLADYLKNASQLGFDSCAYYFFYGQDIVLGKLLKCADPQDTLSGFDGFYDYYARADFAQHDPAINHLIHSPSALIGEKEAFDWQLQTKDRHYTAETQKLVHLAIDSFKIKNLLTIPLFYDSFIGSCITLSSNVSPPEFEDIKQQHSSKLQQLSQDLFQQHLKSHHYKIPIHCLFPDFRGLSTLQHDVLAFQLRGLPMKVIDQHIDVSPPYASNVLGDMRRNLNHITLNQLIHITGATDILSYRPV